VLTRTVLMTGAASSIVVQLLPVFQEQYDPTLVDVKTTNAHGQTGPEVRIANLTETDAEQYWGLRQGIDAVVHLDDHRPTREGMGHWRQRGGEHDQRTENTWSHRISRHRLDVRRVGFSWRRHTP
jgi:hypothetical protein